MESDRTLLEAINSEEEAARVRGFSPDLAVKYIEGCGGDKVLLPLSLQQIVILIECKGPVTTIRSKMGHIA